MDSEESTPRSAPSKTTRPVRYFLVPDGYQLNEGDKERSGRIVTVLARRAIALVLTGKEMTDDRRPLEAMGQALTPKTGSSHLRV